MLDALKKYQSAALVVSETEKMVESDLLEKKTLSNGQLFLAKGKFRWDTSAPEVSSIIFDGTSIYSIQDGQIVRSKITKQIRQQSLMSVLFAPKKLQDRFQILVEKTAEDAVTYSLVPKTKDLEVTDLKISVDKKTQTIKNISYKDEVGNLVNILFKTSVFKTKAEPEHFAFKPKPGDKIIDL